MRAVEHAGNGTATTTFHSGGVYARQGLPYSAHVAPPAHSLSGPEQSRRNR